MLVSRQLSVRLLRIRTSLPQMRLKKWMTPALDFTSARLTPVSRQSGSDRKRPECLLLLFTENIHQFNHSTSFSVILDASFPVIFVTFHMGTEIMYGQGCNSQPGMISDTLFTGTFPPEIQPGTVHKPPACSHPLPYR